MVVRDLGDMEILIYINTLIKWGSISVSYPYPNDNTKDNPGPSITNHMVAKSQHLKNQSKHSKYSMLGNLRENN